MPRLSNEDDLDALGEVYGYDDYDYDEPLKDPPLYPHGRIAAMSLAELEAELTRQCWRQGRLGDMDFIDERAVQNAEAKCEMLTAEIKRRKT